MKRPDAMPDDAIQYGYVIGSYKKNEGERMSENAFEKVTATKYRPDIIERTEKEAR